MKEKVYINGDFVNLDNAKVSVGDLGLNYGYGLFETMQAYNGNIFLFAEHLERLASGARALEVRSPHLKKFTKMTNAGPASELLKLNGLTESRACVKIIVTKGAGAKNATIIIFAKATEEVKNAQQRLLGVKAIIVDEPKRYRPEIKNLNYLPNILSRMEAKKQNAYDALFKTEKNLILEGSASNVFIIKGKRLITPKADGSILPGITRDQIIKLAKTDGLTVTTAPVKTNELAGSDEAFLTNSIIEVVPLVKVNSQTVANGKPGEITKKIQWLYQRAALAK